MFGFPVLQRSIIGPLQDPVTWYGINYTGTQMTQWDFQNKRTRTSPARLSFVLEVPLRHLRPSVIYSVPCDWILQRAYCGSKNRPQNPVWEFTKTVIPFALVGYEVIITNSRYALVGYFITSYPTRAHGIIIIYLQIILGRVRMRNACIFTSTSKIYLHYTQFLYFFHLVLVISGIIKVSASVISLDLD